jgi:Xaa-Pro dipeptidase
VLVDGFLDMGIFKDPDGTTGGLSYYSPEATRSFYCLTNLYLIFYSGLNGHANSHIEPSTTKATVKSREALRKEILLTGLTAAFFPHGVGHSLGMDVHDVPSASRPAGSGKYFVDGDDRASGLPGGHKDFYKYLRLRLELQRRMVVVSRHHLRHHAPRSLITSQNQTIEPGVYFHPALLKSYNVHTSPYINTDILARYECMGGVRIEDDVLITETGYENLTKVQSGVEWVEGLCAGGDLV